MFDDECDPVLLLLLLLVVVSSHLLMIRLFCAVIVNRNLLLVVCQLFIYFSRIKCTHTFSYNLRNAALICNFFAVFGAIIVGVLHINIYIVYTLHSFYVDWTSVSKRTSPFSNVLTKFGISEMSIFTWLNEILCKIYTGAKCFIFFSFLTNPFPF